jgi:hypothetical protein
MSVRACTDPEIRSAARRAMLRHRHEADPIQAEECPRAWNGPNARWSFTLYLPLSRLFSALLSTRSELMRRSWARSAV